MSSIDIPDNIQFTDPDDIKEQDWGGKPRPTQLCFRHAVLRAIQGHKIKTELMDDWCRCDDCDNER